MMKIINCVTLSDTHNRHEEILNIPQCDVLIHAGDAINRGLFSELEEFFEWYSKQPGIIKVFVPGNHEIALYPSDRIEIMERAKEKKLSYKKIPDSQHVIYLNYGLNHKSRNKLLLIAKKKGIIILENQMFNYKGINFYGFPWTPSFGSWVYTRENQELKSKVDEIPDGVNVLISHGPVSGILDDISPKEAFASRFMQRPMVINRGCEFLLKKVNEINPEIFLSGHIHNHSGKVYKRVNKSKENTFICVASFFHGKMLNDKGYTEFDIHFYTEEEKIIIDYVDIKE